MKKFVRFAGIGTLVFGAAGLVFAGYMLVASIPDLKRYVRISTM
jgi:hypothetical protein